MEKKLHFIVNVVFAALVTALALFVLRYLVWWLLPLLLGFCIAFALRPVVNAAYRRSSATRRFCAGVVLFFAYAALFALLWLGLAQLVAGLRALVLALPAQYEESLLPALAVLNHRLTAFLGRFFPQLGVPFATLFELLAAQLEVFLSGLSGGMLERLAAFVTGIPTLLLTFLFTILSSFFISMDYDNVVSFLARLVPRRYRKTLFESKDFLVHSLLQYGKAYFTLLCVTFAEVWAGLALLRVPYSVWWALCIALADLLPAVGTGLILLPWGCLALALGNRFLGIGLLVLYGVITVVRNLLEPKIVGDHIGLPPLATITAMFFGFKLLGVFGMFTAPLVILLLKFLNDSGKIHLWDEKSQPRKNE